MPAPAKPTLTPFGGQLPDHTNPATWVTNTTAFWTWSSGAGYGNQTLTLDYVGDAMTWIEGALSGINQTVVDTQAAILSGASTVGNADRLDGQHGAYYRDAGNLNAGTIPAARLSGSYAITAANATNAATATNAGYASNADRLDGLQSYQLLRTDANDVANGDLIFAGLMDARRSGSSEKIRIGFGSPTSENPFVSFYGGSDRRGYLQFYETYSVWSRDGGAELVLHGVGDARINGHAIHHAGRPAGSVGTYIFANNNSGGTVAFGSTVAGSNLRPSGADGNTNQAYTPSGTWRCMGHKSGTATSWIGKQETTLWLRIA